MSRPTLCSRLHARLRAAYLRLLVRHANFDIELLQAEAAAAPARIRHVRSRVAALQAEISQLEARS